MINSIISADFRIVSFKILFKLLKKLNFDKIYNQYLKSFSLIHLSNVLVSNVYNRIFLLYFYLKKFLIQYWRLKFNFFLSTLV